LFARRAGNRASARAGLIWYIDFEKPLLPEAAFLFLKLEQKPYYTQAMRILVIEDEKKTAAFLAKGLREAGFAVDLARDGETGLDRARATRFDLLIVDVMLPRKDGWDVVAELRRDGMRSEEHTSELQSRRDLVCRLLLEKKKKKT